jgi:hypothetical protein
MVKHGDKVLYTVKLYSTFSLWVQDECALMFNPKGMTALLKAI